ncbi:uncharacterized protein LOC142571721 isoform X2 [Dermacentor variabilis]|uniref:uncharacterized protein LOC142571721 isoform X2 n=1 Tax=Dermacentor variabilis TaxID=34621 RepID=UPI003F5BECE8
MDVAPQAVDMFRRRLALVTGGGSGIGRAVCRLLAQRGARVVVGDVDLEAAHTTVALLQEPSGGAEHRALHIDVGCPRSVSKAFESFEGDRGEQVSIVVHCAGILPPPKSFLDVDVDEFDRISRVNLRGTFLVTQAAARCMLRKKVTDGSIVNMSSVAARITRPGIAAYSATKAAVTNFTRRSPQMRGRRSATAAARCPARALTLALLLTLLHLVLLLPIQAAAQEEDIATTTTTTTTTKRPTASKPREKGLAKHICKGTQKFTNTINLLLTFGKRVLEDPRPLKIGQELGMNVTLDGLDTLSLRGTPQTFCNESVAEALLPLRLSPSIVLHRRRSILFGANSDRNVSYTLSGLEMDVGVRVNRNDPNRHVEITSLDIVYVDTVEIEVKTFAPISGRPITMFFERPPTAVKLAILRPIIQAGLQRMIDSGGFKLSS